MRHINETPPSVLERRPDVPPRLAALMQRSLTKDPERRPMMSEVVQELERCLEELPAEVDTLSNVTAVRRRPPGALGEWQLRAILAGLLVAAAAGVYLVAFRSHGSSPPAAAKPVHLRATTAYDPDGTNGENNAQAPLATDGNASTAWQTETYRDAPSLDKPGVGLLLDAGRPVSLHRITVTTSTPGFVARIEAGSSPHSFPDIVSASKTAGTRTVFDVTGGSHRYYVLWITRLGRGFANARIVQVAGAQ
jgi:hypothetical protein